jgi:hypothetical protein
MQIISIPDWLSADETFLLVETTAKGRNLSMCACVYAGLHVTFYRVPCVPVFSYRGVTSSLGVLSYHTHKDGIMLTFCSKYTHSTCGLIAVVI